MKEIVAVIPIVFFFGFLFMAHLNKRWVSLYRKHMEFFDMRIKTLKDMGNTIKLIKSNSWELVMEYFINRKRIEEKYV